MELMKRRGYRSPQITVVVLRHDAALLTGSPTLQGNDSFTGGGDPLSSPAPEYELDGLMP